MGSPGYDNYSNLILPRKKSESSLHGLTKSKVINPGCTEVRAHGEGSLWDANQTAGFASPASRRQSHGLNPRGGGARSNNPMLSGPHVKAFYSVGNSVSEGAEERAFGAQKSHLFCLPTLVETASAPKLT